MRLKPFFLILVALALLVLMGTLNSRESRKGIPDTEIGLSKSSVFDSPASDTTRTNQSDPGDRQIILRQFFDQPPLIPHGVIEFLPVTARDNQCIACHDVDEKERGEPTPVPSSHHVDFRNSPEVVGDDIVGARYNCVSCHVSPGDNEPLVGTAYIPNTISR